MIGIQLRVVVALKYWVETQMDDFDENLLASLIDFVDNIIGNSSLKKVIENQVTWLSYFRS